MTKEKQMLYFSEKRHMFFPFRADYISEVGSLCFPFRVVCFSEGSWSWGKQTLKSLKNCVLKKKDRKTVMYTQSVQGDWMQLVDFLPFLARETTVMASCYFYCTPTPFWKGVYSHKKEMFPQGASSLFYSRPFYRIDWHKIQQLSPFWKCISSPCIIIDWCGNSAGLLI